MLDYKLLILTFLIILFGIKKLFDVIQIMNKKIICMIIICMLLIINFSSILTVGKNNTTNTKSILSSRYNLGTIDESMHQNKIFEMQEWWYYNIYFNNETSQLYNWSIVISFLVTSKMSSLKLILYDEKNKSYDGSIIKNPDSFKSKGSGVDICFNNISFANGKYPNWHVYAESKEENNSRIIANLTFIANSLPMWILKNSGHNRSNSYFGYYCIMNCIAYGSISLNGTIYNVTGLGYHDHTWAPINLKIPKFFNKKNKQIMNKNRAIDIYNSWDWLCIHFKNGWDMFIGKVYPKKRNDFTKYMPGILCFTPNGKKLYESRIFLLEYKEYNTFENSNISHPTKIHIKAFILNTRVSEIFKGPILLDFYYEAINIQEELFGNPPNWGLWQSQGKTYGFAKNLRKTFQLDGWAIVETTNSI